jgi:hypothetical protein
MQKGKIRTQGHVIEVKAENLQEEKIEKLLLNRDILNGKKEGILYGKAPKADEGVLVDIPEIGTWRIVNEEAEKWENIADLLYTALLIETADVEIREDDTDTALIMYEKLKTTE